MPRIIALLIALSVSSCVTVSQGAPRPEAPTAEPSWQRFERAAFETAQREHKLILLSVQAGWCHWCHVMNATTYRDRRVLALLQKNFVVIRVEQDKRPDLAERYAAWGWPATALLTPQATPIVTLRGHQPAPKFAALLSELVAERDAGKPFRVRTSEPATHGAVASDLSQARDLALAQLDAVYDERAGGWGTPQKYPFAAPVQHALLRAAFYGEGERFERGLATLRGHAELIDPVAGGMFQYSLRGRWNAPHFEKIAAIQAMAIDNFAEAYRATREAEFRSHAERVAGYVLQTLRDASGAFYASQDADVGHVGRPGHLTGMAYYAGDAQGRSKSPAPAVDRHVYANLNGMLIRALCGLYRANGDERYLSAARRALDAVRKTHAHDAGFMHEVGDDSGVFYLSDQVEMLAAMFAIAEATSDARLTDEADAALVWTLRAFADDAKRALFAHTPSRDAVGVFGDRTKPYADNALLARLLLQRARARDEDELAQRARAILLDLADAQGMAAQGRKIGDYLLALEYALGPSMMISIVGHADDVRTVALHRAAYDAYLPQAFVQVEAPEVSHYPYAGVPTAYFCSDNACSEPIADPAILPAALQGFAKAQ
jgi:uncharacterized protein YyaL (SSP411 family)